MTDRFRIACATMIANEADIIESFVRHNLSFVDHVHIQFHNSYDASQQITELLAAEGLPISFERNDDPIFRRELMGDRLVRELAQNRRFEFILPLDADEFIVADSRLVLEAELETIPLAGALRVAWLSYVPTERDDPSDPNPATRIRHRLRSPHSIRKVFFRAQMLTDDDVLLSDGNHFLVSRQNREIQHVLSDRVFLAHFPIRTPQQFASKIAIGIAARTLEPGFNDAKSRHWRALSAEIANIATAPVERLSQYATEYLNDADGILIEAPLSTMAKVLKYTGLANVNAFDRLWSFVAALLIVMAPAVRQMPSGAAPTVSSDQERRSLLLELDNARNMVRELHQYGRRYRRWCAVLVVLVAILALFLLIFAYLLR